MFGKATKLVLHSLHRFVHIVECIMRLFQIQRYENIWVGIEKMSLHLNELYAIAKLVDGFVSLDVR